MLPISYDQMTVISGFLHGICDHIAIEQTQHRSDSKEVFHRSMYLQQTYQEFLLLLWSSIAEENDIADVVEHLIRLSGKGLTEEDEKKLPQVAGYAVGAACAGYTMIALTSKNHALDIRTGELWMAAKLIIPEEVEEVQEVEDPNNLDNEIDVLFKEYRLIHLVEAVDTITRLRWITEPQQEDTWYFIKGAALPSGFLTPIIDLQFIRTNSLESTVQ